MCLFLGVLDLEEGQGVNFLHARFASHARYASPRFF